MEGVFHGTDWLPMPWDTSPWTRWCPFGHLSTGLSCLFSGSHCPQLEGAMVHPPAEHAAVLQARGGSEGDPSQGTDPSGWLHHHLPLLGVREPTRKWRPWLPGPTLLHTLPPPASFLKVLGVMGRAELWLKNPSSNPGCTMYLVGDLGEIIKPLWALVLP